MKKISTSRAAQGQIWRKRHQYRSLFLNGQTSLSHKSAVRLVGPDCACHLNRMHQACKYSLALPNSSVAADTIVTNRTVFVEIRHLFQRRFKRVIGHLDRRRPEKIFQHGIFEAN